MKNVKSMFVSDSEKGNLSFIERVVLGLMKLRFRWKDEWGFDLDRMVIEGENKDVWMRFDDCMDVRFEPNDELYYVERMFGGGNRWFKVGAFNLIDMDNIADSFISLESDWGSMLSVYSSEIEEEVMSVEKALAGLSKKFMGSSGCSFSGVVDELKKDFIDG